MCRLNITREEQLNNFNSYWEKGEYLKRKNYIKQLINVHPKHRSRGNDIKNRQCSATYQLYGQRGKIDVCRGCFLLTLGESKSFVEDVVGKLWQDEKSVEIEARGRNTPPNKTSDEKLEEVQNHIGKFPAYESHYSRAHTSKKYLQPNLNISIMYNMYTEETTDPVSLTIYRQEFKKTGLKFKSPQIDTCRRCDEYKTSLKYEKDVTKQREIETARDLHQQAADNAYEVKRKDKRQAKLSNGSEVVASFDLQQCLPTPCLQTSVVFYKRQLWTYNLTINNNTAKATKCYMWHESIAKRGGNEIASCLHHFVGDLDRDVRHLVLFSDCCAGQNKNKIVSAMMSLTIANHPSLETVDHKFLVSGHTHMECDSDHALIERAKKTAGDIHTPEDWYSLVRSARNDNPYEVIELDQSMIYNFEILYKGILIARKKDEKGELFSMQKVRWLRYTKEQGIVYYKYTLSDDEEFSKLDLRRQKKFVFNDEDLELRYSEPVKITKEKKEDLIFLLSYIPPSARDFYSNLPAIQKPSTTGNYDPDIEDIEELELVQENVENVELVIAKSITRAKPKKKAVASDSEDCSSIQHQRKKPRSEESVQTMRRSARLLNKKRPVHINE